MTMVALKTEAIRLRVQDRLSLGEIAKTLGISKTTASLWLRDYPLTKGEVDHRHEANRYRPPKKDRGSESKFHLGRSAELFDRRQKMRVAESAVLFRLCWQGFNAYKPAFDGDRVDWIVQTDDKLLRLQVKWVKFTGSGLPQVSLQCMESGSYRRYTKEDFDFIVGYDYFTDIAYVYSYDETSRCKTHISVAQDAAERWDKLSAG